jgi:hypothetical protein
MSGFKLCPNGHYFHENLDECPYCPKQSQNKPDMDLDKTKIEGSNNIADDKTQIFGSGGGNLNKTQIFHGEPGSDDAPDFQGIKNNAGRKLVGWLVSFTIDANGVDYKLYEGRNIIGSDPACDAVVPADGSVSGKHLTILYRMGVFKFKDELSTNGTFINDEFKEEGNLNDGDNIKIGNTVLKFRTVA